MKYTLLLLVCFFGYARPARANLPDISGLITEVKFAYELDQTGVLPGVLAKELCSCHFVSKLTFEQCKTNTVLPGATFWIARVNIDDAKHLVTATSVGFNVTATASYDVNGPQFGCVLQTEPVMEETVRRN